jgi:hypothetical protein
MGMIGEVFALAGLHVDTASFAQYGTALQGAEVGIGNFATSTQTLMAGAFAIPAAAVIGAASYGVSLASGFEKTHLQLTSLLGSQAKAGEMMTYLSNLAAKTPFEFPELANAATKLIGAGLDAKEYMTVIGDVAAGTQKSVDQVTEAFLDAQNGEWERLKELQITHLTVSEDNYRQYGASVEQIGKDILVTYDGNGKQLVEIFDKSSKEATNAALKNLSVEKFAGSMDLLAGTISGKWSTIKDNINNTLVSLVGFDTSTGQVSGLYLALTDLASIAITVTGSFSGMSEPMKTFVVVGAAAAAAGILVAGGMIAASAAGITLAAVGAAISLAFVAIILPVAAVAVGIGLLAAGLVYLDEKTGIVTAVWTELADEFTIAEDRLSTGWTNLSTWIGARVAEIKAYLTDIIPASTITAINDFVTLSSGLLGDIFGGTTSDNHAEAEIIRARKAAEKVVELKITADTAPATKSINTLDGLLNKLPPDALNATTALTKTGNVPATGSIAAVQGVDTEIKNATASSTKFKTALETAGNFKMTGISTEVSTLDSLMKTLIVDDVKLKTGLDAAGKVSFDGTNSQLVLTDINGKTANITALKLQEYLLKAGNVSSAGTIGQIGLVDSTGKTTNLTIAQAGKLLTAAGLTDYSALRNQIGGIATSWDRANAAANAYAKAAIGQAQAEITYRNAMKGSTSTGQSKDGVTVIAAPKTPDRRDFTVVSPSKTTMGPTTNNSYVGTINYNGNAINKSKTTRSILGGG